MDGNLSTPQAEVSTTDPEPPGSITYLYNTPVPGPAAAMMQILRTARALAEQGMSTRVVTGPLTSRSVEAMLRWYGIEPHERLHVIPLFDPPHRPPTTAQLRELRAMLLDAEDGDARVLIYRGPFGMAAQHWMQRHGPSHWRHVLDLYRLFGWSYRHSGTKPTSRLARFHQMRTQVRAAGLERRAVAAAQGLVCNSEGLAAAVQQHYRPTAPLCVLPSGVAVEPRPRATEARDIELVYIGKLAARKGVDQLAPVMAALPGRTLHVIGGPAEAVTALQQSARAASVTERLVCHGHLSPPASRTLLQRAQVGLCPLPRGVDPIAERFSSPMKLLEMLACGVAVVASDLPTTRAILRDGKTGLLTPANEPGRMAEAAGRLLADPARQSELADAGWQAVHAYTWQRRARRLRAFLNNLR